MDSTTPAPSTKKRDLSSPDSALTSDSKRLNTCASPQTELRQSMAGSDDPPPKWASALIKDVHQLTPSVNSIKNDISRMQTQIKKIETDTATALCDLSTRVSANQTNIHELQVKSNKQEQELKVSHSQIDVLAKNNQDLTERLVRQECQMRRDTCFSIVSLKTQGKLTRTVKQRCWPFYRLWKSQILELFCLLAVID